ncbi:hypothetical protein MF271_00840 (plasmid) [Deinococcus sp. KNUC1210]|uniref:hypothetical protein n=1 Tax=Deinococcus sp. KNUC1210 TaxID=2917691 RepID=UPI001EF15A57|nr:hypothetical protein [Deinococcus sp. KNUC1210]ULH14058.1 hypothetical protein MF271_00840 [Deinococcus sp. KNUC1210]
MKFCDNHVETLVAPRAADGTPFVHVEQQHEWFRSGEKGGLFVIVERMFQRSLNALPIPVDHSCAILPVQATDVGPAERSSRQEHSALDGACCHS